MTVRATAVAVALLACALPAAADVAIVRPVSASFAPAAADRAALAADLDALLGGADAVHGAHVGLFVQTADGMPLYVRGADDAYAPGSTLKLIGGIAALERLTPDFRFKTRAFASSALAGDRLAGTLVVRAGGDPSLDAAAFDELAAALAARGIRRIDGGVAFDQSHFEAPAYPAGWAIDDLPYDYAPPVGALDFSRNALAFTVMPGAAAGAPAVVRAAPVDTGRAAACADGAVAVVNEIVTTAAGGSTDLDVVRTPQRPACTRLIGTIALGAAPQTLGAAAADPARVAAVALHAALARAGIAAGDDPSALPAAVGTPLWTHVSAPLAALVAACWLPSDNLAAELFVRELAVAEAGEPGTLEAGLAAERRWLHALGVDDAHQALADGSGLSAYDRVTPRALVTVLAHAWTSPLRDAVLDALPVAGVRGTLASSFADTAAAGRVFAKTGTVSHASALAGYVATRRHGALVFAFLVDDWVGGTPAALRALRGRVLARLVDA